MLKMMMNIGEDDCDDDADYLMVVGMVKTIVMIVGGMMMMVMVLVLEGMVMMLTMLTIL